VGARWVQRWSKVIDRLPSFFLPPLGAITDEAESV
jgi:hypothetical protein